MLGAGLICRLACTRHGLRWKIASACWHFYGVPKCDYFCARYPYPASSGLASYSDHLYPCHLEMSVSIKARRPYNCHMHARYPGFCSWMWLFVSQALVAICPWFFRIWAKVDSLGQMAWKVLSAFDRKSLLHLSVILVIEWLSWRESGHYDWRLAKTPAAPDHLLFHWRHSGGNCMEWVLWDSPSFTSPRSLCSPGWSSAPKFCVSPPAWSNWRIEKGGTLMNLFKKTPLALDHSP